LTEHTTIEVFGNDWWMGNLSTIFVIIAIIFLGKKSNNVIKERILKIIGGISLFRWVFIQYYAYDIGIWSVQSSLPLQMCSFSSLFCGIVVFYRKQYLYEFVYYMGISSAIHSLLTPEFTMGNEGYLFFEYYLNHGLIALIPLYFTLVLNYKPKKYSWLTTILYAQILIMIAGTANWLFGANYMYLAEKPIVNNPFVIGEWPWYIFGLQFAGLLHFIILYIPFSFKNKFSEVEIKNNELEIDGF